MKSVAMTQMTILSGVNLIQSISRVLRPELLRAALSFTALFFPAAGLAQGTAIDFTRWYQETVKSSPAPTERQLPIGSFRKIVNEGTSREYPVYVRAPELQNALTYELRLTNSPETNARNINCVLSRRSTSRLYGSQPCQGVNLPGLSAISANTPLILRLIGTMENGATFKRHRTDMQGVILIASQSNLVISSDVAPLRFPEETSVAIMINDSKQIRLSGLQIHHGEAPSLSGTVVNTDRGVLGVRLEQPLSDSSLRSIDIKAIYGIDLSQGRERMYVAKPHIVLPLQAIMVVGGRQDVLFLDPNVPANANLNLAFRRRFRVGDTVLLSSGRGSIGGENTGSDTIAAIGRNTEDISYFDVQVFSTPNKAFNAFGTGRGLWLKDCRVTYADASQLLVSPGAAFRATGTGGDLVLEGNRFEGVGDDVAVAVGSWYLVDSHTVSSDGRTIDFEGSGSAFAPQERVALFRNTERGFAPLAFLRVRNAQIVNGKSRFQGVLETGSLAGLSASEDYIVYSLTQTTSRSYIVGNKFLTGPSNGLMLSTNNVYLEDNDFMFTAIGGIKIAINTFIDRAGPGGRQRRMVGATSYNVSVFKNDILDTANGMGNNAVTPHHQSAIAVTSWGVGSRGSGFPAFSGIELTGNTIRSGWTGISVNQTRGIQITGNTIAACTGRYASLPSGVAPCGTAIRVFDSRLYNSDMATANTFNAPVSRRVDVVD